MGVWYSANKQYATVNLVGVYIQVWIKLCIRSCIWITATTSVASDTNPSAHWRTESMSVNQVVCQLPNAIQFTVSLCLACYHLSDPKKVLGPRDKPLCTHIINRARKLFYMVINQLIGSCNVWIKDIQFANTLKMLVRISIVPCWQSKAFIFQFTVM